MIGDHNQRCITKEEFEEQKRKILQEMSSLKFIKMCDCKDVRCTIAQYSFS